ncbi:MAG: hypothetical protein HQK83_05095 [Fibrobacteria bacterium]|nr:hypothetical protein [Fibrobacteria bacterium]
MKFHDNSMPIYMGSPFMLAAGGNKSGKNLNHFHSFGLGAVTLGTATFKPWTGNPYRPRVRLLPKDYAIINNMGFNNPGIEQIAYAADFHLGRCHRQKLAVGISIAETPDIEPGNHQAKIEDLLKTFRKAYRAADYIEVNVSNPISEETRIDWQKDFLKNLLAEIMEFRKALVPRKAVFIKLSPDMNQSSLDATLEIISDSGVTGVVLFNTFPVNRVQYLNMQTTEAQFPQVSKDKKKGGISGRILYKNTLPAVTYIRKQLPKLTIIASGGVDHGAKALELLEAGADAVQCLSVMAYRWNAIHRLEKELMAAMGQKGYKFIDNIVTP